MRAAGKFRGAWGLALAVLVALLAAAPAWAGGGAGNGETTLSVLTGGIVAMGGDAAAAVSPAVMIEVETPFADTPRAPRLVVTAELSALPGEALDVEDPGTWRSLEFRVGASQPLARALRFHLFAAAGFATRLPGTPEPRDKTARWGSVGLRFAGARGVIELGAGGDQRLDGRWQAAVTISGRVKLWEATAGPLEGGQLALVGSAVLGLDLSGRYARLDGGPRDVVRVGLVVGR